MNIESENPDTKVQPCRAYFYVVEGSFPHLAICLAEGFKALGIPAYSNLNYWLTSPDSEEYLFTHDPDIHPQDCSMVIMDKNWAFSPHPALPEAIYQPQRNYLTIYLDDMDGLRASVSEANIPKFDFIFRTHCHSRTQNPGNFVPWVFGLSNRILNATENSIQFLARESSILFNYRVYQDYLLVANWPKKIDEGVLIAEKGVIWADYPLRLVMRDRFLPLIEPLLSVNKTIDTSDNAPSESYDLLHWQQTGHRHHPQYYQRLKNHQACAAFAGWLVPESATNPPYVAWWDSWRFWESLAAGCVTFHMDFDKYGVELPVKPENWKHYIGIDIDQMEEGIDRIASEPNLLKNISQAGREWAWEHYSPVPTALRFLKILGFKTVGDFLPFELRGINLIAFPDWSKAESQLYEDLSRLLKTVFNHGDRPQISLLIDTTDITLEEANQVLSHISFDLLMSQEIVESSPDNEPAIVLLEPLDSSQWQVLRYHLHARIALNYDNQEAIAGRKLQDLPLFS
jgi:hypothetical protein